MSGEVENSCFSLRRPFLVISLVASEASLTVEMTRGLNDLQHHLPLLSVTDANAQHLGGQREV